MPTRLAPVHVRNIIVHGRTLGDALADLGGDDGSGPSHQLIESLAPKVDDLMRSFRRIDEYNAQFPAKETAVEHGGGKLSGFDAEVYLNHARSLRQMVFGLATRWEWSHCLASDGVPDAPRLAKFLDHLPRPSISDGDLRSYREILARLALERGNMKDWEREHISETPPPVKRGPDSWKIPGSSPLLPGQPVSNPKTDLVRFYKPADRGMLDISDCRKWYLDRPYAEVSHPERGEPEPRLERFDEPLPWPFGPDEVWPWPGSDKTEFRCVLRSADGAFYLLGAPSREWYSDNRDCEDGTSRLASHEADFFHGEISLLVPGHRGLYVIDPSQALEVLVDSGHGDNLPEDLHRLIANGQPKEARASSTEQRNQWLYERAMAGTKYDVIRAELSMKIGEPDSSQWGELSSGNSVLVTVRRYAASHNLPKPPRNEKRDKT